MTDVVWEDPPPPPVSRVDRVAAELRGRPGTWAKIAHADGPVLVVWWGPLTNDPEIETRIRLQQPDRPFEPRDVYAKFVGDKAD